MIVTIHQPNFAPWTGFFDKLASAEVMVLLDVVPFSKGSYANRVHILGADGPQWLTVPVLTKGRLGQRTNEVEINDARDWRSDHLKTLQILCGRSPFLADVLGLVEPAYAAPHPLLADLCTDLITRVVTYLGYSTRLVRASSLTSRGSSSELLAAITAELGGTTYLSGPSGRTYLEHETFDSRGIGVSYHSYIPRPYDQSRRDFVPRLSILDAIAWRGPDAAAAVRSA